MSLDNQVVLVTGGGRAIGRSIALRLARDVAAVSVLGTAQAELEETAAEIRRLGGRGLAVAADVSCEEQVQAAVAQARSVLGPIDVLINNAAIIGPTALTPNIERRQWDEVLAVNLTGAFLCSKAVAPDMIDRRSGKIVNIASVAGKLAYPLRSPYAVSKWGLIGFTMTLAKELGQYDIQVNAVCPGPVEGERMETIIQRRAEELEQTVEQVREKYVRAAALQRMVRQDDVAAMVAFLVSAQADNITGQAIDVSAGYAL